jgi:hypothetical protein
MPIGSRYVLEGILRRQRYGYQLEVEGGGLWFLDFGWRSAGGYLDQRVTIEGQRLEARFLKVETLRVDGEAQHLPDQFPDIPPSRR